jgi:hypothetical protein
MGAIRPRHSSSHVHTAQAPARASDNFKKRDSDRLNCLLSCRECTVVIASPIQYNLAQC